LNRSRALLIARGFVDGQIREVNAAPSRQTPDAGDQP
jgi:hypothetical protein